MKPTHIIRYNETQKAQWLFRASDGMMIGVVEKITIIYGDDPNRRVSRVFMEHEYATRYLREVVARKDLETNLQDYEFRVEYQNEEAVILQPGSVVMPGSGSIHRIS